MKQTTLNKLNEKKECIFGTIHLFQLILLPLHNLLSNYLCHSWTIKQDATNTTKLASSKNPIHLETLDQIKALITEYQSNNYIVTYMV
jgi:hypothetical protein